MGEEASLKSPVVRERNKPLPERQLQIPMPLFKEFNPSFLGDTIPQRVWSYSVLSDGFLVDSVEVSRSHVQIEEPHIGVRLEMLIQR